MPACRGQPCSRTVGRETDQIGSRIPCFVAHLRDTVLLGKKQLFYFTKIIFTLFPFKLILSFAMSLFATFFRFLTLRFYLIKFFTRRYEIERKRVILNTFFLTKTRLF